MTLADWIPAISTTTLLGFVAVAFVPLYRASVEKALQHAFDRKIEELRSQMRREEDALKAELKSRDEQILTLRNSVLARFGNRNAELERRKLESLESLWVSVVGYATHEYFAKMWSVLNVEAIFDEVRRGTADAPKARQVADMIWKTSGAEGQAIPPFPDKNRPYIPTSIWAAYSAYRGILAQAAMQNAVLRTGVSPEILADSKPLIESVKLVVPHFSEFLDRFGANGLLYLLENLREHILGLIVANLDGGGVDDLNIKKVSRIIRAAEVEFSRAGEKTRMDVGSLALRPEEVAAITTAKDKIEREKL